jgi:hypothetical protein
MGSGLLVSRLSVASGLNLRGDVVVFNSNA